MSTETPENDLPPEELDQVEETLDAEPEEPVDPMTALEQERDKFRDQFLRTAAEMENFRKRVNREREEDRKYSNFGLISDLLPAIDNLQRAIDAVSGDESTSGILQGVEMVLKQFEEILSRNGAEVIEAQGLPFDPNFHEALQQRPTADAPPMTVVEVLERGVKIHDRVIRPSKVIVAIEPTEKSE